MSHSTRSIPSRKACCIIDRFSVSALVAHRVSWLLLLSIALCAYVFVIVWVSGHWNEQKQRMQLSPILSVLIVILLFSCVLAFLQHMFAEVSVLSAYIFPLCIATTTLIMAIIIGVLERRYR